MSVAEILPGKVRRLQTAATEGEISLLDSAGRISSN
jgi:hypothetical protein